MENVNIGCNLVEAALRKIGKAGTWSEFNEAVGRSVPVGTKRLNDHGFEMIRNAFHRGEGIGRRFLVSFLPCGNMRSATINEIIMEQCLK